MFYDFRIAWNSCYIGNLSFLEMRIHFPKTSLAQNEMENCIKSNNDEVLKDFWMKYVASSFCCHDGNFIISHFSQISLFTSFLESFSKRREKMCNCDSAIRCIDSKTGLFANFFQSHDSEIIKVKCEAGRTIKILHFWLVHTA